MWNISYFFGRNDRRALVVASLVSAPIACRLLDFSRLAGFAGWVFFKNDG